jgi:tripartite-type tricarboxylate transporter receptor subunit TctC
MKRIALLLFALLALAVAAHAQSYPNKPIRIVVPYGAGGATDALARPIAMKLSEILGQQVLVENVAGAGTIIGTMQVANAVPDGYTLLLNPASHGLIPFYNKNAKYDPVKDFTPIAAVGVSQRVIVATPSLPVNSLKELIGYAKANPGKLSYGIASAGTVQELAGDLLRVRAGIDLTPIGYKGGGSALTDLLGGQIQIAILVLPDTLQYIRSGRLKALGVIESRRSKAAPDIPTVAEAGVPGYATPEQWVGLMGPAGLPAPIVAKLNEAVNKALRSPDTLSTLEKMGYEPMGGPPSDLAKRMVDDVQVYRRFATEINLTPR